jgi:hypothetical protein
VVRDLTAAVAVDHEPRTAALGVVPIAPLKQPHQGRPKVEALLRKPVLEALGTFLIAVALEHALVHESSEPVGQDVAGDAEALLELLEASHSEEGVADHEHRPAVAHQLERASDGAVL